MDSNLVIKVKYGDVLRRFTASVNGNGSLDIGMVGLTAKIRNLFKFASHDEIIITYIDEDKDVITLVDDDDLCDVIRQRLNPLRVNVQLKVSGGGGTFDTRSSGWSTPISSQQGQSNPLSNINSGLVEMMKSLPEPVTDVISKISYDLASKTVLSAPVLTEFIDFLTKSGLHPLVPAPQSQGYESESSEVNKVAEGLEASKNPPTAEKLVKAKSIDPGETSNSKGFDSCNMSRGVGTSNHPTTNMNPLKESNGLEHSNTKRYVPSFSVLPTGQSKMPQKDKDDGKSVGAGPSVSSAPLSKLDPNCSQDSFPVVLEEPYGSFSSYSNNRKTFESGKGQSSAPSTGFSHNTSPFSGMTGSDSSDIVPPVGSWAAHPFRRSYSHRDSMGRIFHKGVRCDGCGVHPITGPRFKSKVREDYDLCRICFSEIGSEAEYTRIDHPISYRSPCPFKEHRTLLPPPPPPSVLRRPGIPLIVRKKRQSLDSCFVQDVNIPDGTLIAPATPFTKIWRMRNNGADPWPLGTQLVWIGGYQFTTTNSVSVQIPGDGCAVEKQLDIAVDFTAPGLPGRYISYWRMVSPSGQKFGQRIWVLIEVDTSQVDTLIHDSLSQSINSFNLNLPPKYSQSDELQSQIIDMNAEPIDDDSPESENSIRNAESVKPMVDEDMKDKEEFDFPVNDELDCHSTVAISSVEPAFVSYPAIDSSVQPPVLVDALPTGEVDDNMVEETLLKELEEMGFKQINLNKEILRRNEYNLEQSVDDLCGVSEWDPILEELQEMGFCDKETNKRLLMKNGGSIKRVVMDLVAGERA